MSKACLKEVATRGALHSYYHALLYEVTDFIKSFPFQRRTALGKNRKK